MCLPFRKKDRFAGTDRLDRFLAVADPIRLELALRRSEGEASIRKRLDRTKREGDLPPHADPADLARCLATVYQGMSVQAAGGATREQLRRVAKIALRAWPK